MPQTPPSPDFNTTYQDHVFAEDSYFKETQLDIWQHEKKKTMQAIFAIGAILLGSDLLALLMANALTPTSFCLYFSSACLICIAWPVCTKATFGSSYHSLFSFYSYSSHYYLCLRGQKHC